MDPTTTTEEITPEPTEEEGTEAAIEEEAEIEEEEAAIEEEVPEEAVTEEEAVPAEDILELPDLSGPGTGISLVAALVLTQLTKIIAQKRAIPHALLKPIVPILAVLIAVFVRAMIDTVGGDPINAATLWQGIAAGAGAVGAHSQWRSFTKHAPDLVAAIKRGEPPEA